MHQKSLDIHLKVFGPDHLEPAKTKVNMAIVYKNMGEYEKALDTYNEALPVLEATLGRNHLVVAKTYNNIGEVYRHQAKYPEALAMYDEKSRQVKAYPGHFAINFTKFNSISLQPALLPGVLLCVIGS